ncbi:methyltransferase, FkbM family [Austwickia chelonae]|uniref:Putative glycosyltransferase n=1 Tax=Austwickia chelonae NBRC 105200 TaxID=1184607 RepID=K6VM91_9MICO|nr:FkbM family methyltransferase [Austwickia chelonae]GAB77869.1 putative glycosyltransferase [Austwickia chelonae NBRC 105200]SEV91202.1 methyltransferase, FkbM family [Austwickia chelonae]
MPSPDRTTGPRPARTGVVVITYDDQTGLDRCLAALDRQTDPDGKTPEFTIVVVDDGSRRAPRLGRRCHPTSLIRLPDNGFQAARARNAGARALIGQGCGTLLFLDGDMICEPDYVDRIGASCRDAASAAEGAARGRGLAVGRRRHADLTGLDVEQTMAFVSGADRPAARILTDPSWLADGYAATADLRNADERSYRFVISAVLALTSELWQATQGFDDDRFTSYGGEDWEFAHRAWLAGAALRHEPAAVAWHDGPDAGGRERDPAAKTRETVRIAETITAPGARDPRVRWDFPEIAIDLDDRRLAPETVLLLAADLLAGSDARAWLRDGTVVRQGLWPAGDTRLSIGPVPAEVRARCRFVVEVTDAVVPEGTLAQLCALGPAAYEGLVVRASRADAQGERPPRRNAPALRRLTRSRHLEGVWGGWVDRHDGLRHDVDLALQEHLGPAVQVVDVRATADLLGAAPGAPYVVTVVDIGANPLDEPPYRPLLEAGLARVVGFEPQPQALARLAGARSEQYCYVGAAVGDGAAHRLYVCASDGFSSLHPPDPGQLRVFSDFPELAAVTEVLSSVTTRVDDLPQIDRMELLKIDAQGSELMILQGAPRLLASTVAVQVEVGYHRLYRGAPLAGDVDCALREHGFVPHAFVSTRTWPLAPVPWSDPFQASARQLVEADLLYVRDPARLDRLSCAQLRALVLVVVGAYRSPGVGLVVLHELVRRGEISGEVLEAFRAIWVSDAAAG